MANIRDIYFPTIPNMFPEELVANGFKEQTALGVAVYKARESNALYGVEAGKFYWVNTNGEHIPFFSEAEVAILETSGAPTNTPETGDAYITVDADGVLYIWDDTNEVWVASGGNANIYTANGTLLADRTVTGGGNDLTFTDIPLFNIDSTIARLGQVPTTANANTQVLTRNSVTGNIEVRDASSLISGTDTNFALNNLTFDANRTHTLGTFNLTLNGTAASGSSFNLSIDNINLNDNVRTKVRTLLNLQSVPATNTTATFVLVRDSGTGNVEQLSTTNLTNFLITDGTTTSTINGGETISINESASTGPIKISLTGNNYTLELDTTGASTGDVLTLNAGNLVFQTPATATNIYTADGTLTGNRVLNGNNSNLTFNTLSQFILVADDIDLEGVIHLITPNVTASTASTGQFLQLVNGVTGEVEWATVSAFGTVTSFSAGTLNPIFTTSVATATTTPALSFSLSNAAAYTILGNNTNVSAVPTYFTPVLASALFRNQGTVNTVLHGNASGNPSWSKIDLTADIINDLPVTHLDGGLNASSTTFWRGDGTWQTIATGGSVTSVAATAPAAGFTIAGSPITTSGTFVFTLANDLAAIEGLSGTGIARRTAADTWSVGSIVDIAEGGTGLNSLGTAGQVLTVNAGATGLEYTSVSGGTVTSFSAGDLSPLFTTTEATVTTTPALSFSLTNAGANTYFGNATGGATAPSYTAAGALTKVDDTNVTLTLGGDPSVSLLKAASLTLGWTGTLGVARGGTNIASYTAGDILYATGTTTLAKLPVGTNGDVLTLVTGLPAWVTGGGGGYTDEQAQDAVGLILLDSDTINFNYDDAAPNITATVITQMSVTSDASGVKLVNDATTPANLQSYKTTILGTKGWANDFLQYDSSESVWSPYLVAHASKNIGGGFAENILIGKAAGQNLTTGHRITIVGSGSNGFVLDDAEYVSIFGYANALANANGYGSTLIGSLNDDTTSGTFNTIVGYNNLLSVLGNNSTASSNTIVGYGNAVEVSGNGNVILGYENLTVGTSVADSVIIGHNNGQGITTTDGLIIIGSNSGNGAALGQRSIIIGTDAAPILTGAENTIIGTNSATLATSGTRNVLIGSGAGTNLTTGGTNVFIGRASGGSVSTGTGNIFINGGFSADTSNSIFINGGSALTASNIISIGNGITDVYLGQSPTGGLSDLIYHGPRGQTTGVADQAGNNWTFKGGAGSGNALPGKIIFQTSDPIASGITVQTLTDTLSVEGSFVHIEKGLGLKVEVSSATSLTLAAKSTYVFTGSSATTWTLPAVSGNTDRTYFIKNKGSAIITLTAAGADKIYLTSQVATLLIHPGESHVVINDGTDWSIL